MCCSNLFALCLLSSTFSTPLHHAHYLLTPTRLRCTTHTSLQGLLHWPLSSGNPLHRKLCEMFVIPARSPRQVSSCVIGRFALDISLIVSCHLFLDQVFEWG